MTSPEYFVARDLKGSKDLKDFTDYFNQVLGQLTAIIETHVEQLRSKNSNHFNPAEDQRVQGNSIQSWRKFDNKAGVGAAATSAVKMDSAQVSGSNSNAQEVNEPKMRYSSIR